MPRLSGRDIAELVRTSVPSSISKKLARDFKSASADAKRRAGGSPKPITDPFVRPPVTIGGSGPNILPPPIETLGVENMSIGGFGGINIGGGNISATGDLFGIPISATLPFPGGGGGSEPGGGGGGVVPGDFSSVKSKSLVAGPGTGSCPGLFSVRGPDGSCIDLGALPPGGDPAMTGRVELPGGSDGYGAAVRGFFGVGLIPRVEVRTVRMCPPGTALGKDGVCYEGLGRNSKKRMHPLGMKPLLTGGDRQAIARAKRVAGSLNRAKKSLKKTAKELEKAGC